MFTEYLLRVGYSSTSRGFEVEQGQHCPYSHRAYSLAQEEIKIISKAKNKGSLEKASLRKFLLSKDQKDGED